MTGPEHYFNAEHLLTSIREKDEAVHQAMAILAAAQAHATLALAAATALGYDHVPTRDYQAWLAAAGTPDGAT